MLKFFIPLDYLLSKFYLIEDVEKVFRETFDIPENRNVHLWIRSGSRLYEELVQKNQPIQELSYLSSQTIIGEDGTYGTKIADRYVLGFIKSLPMLFISINSLFKFDLVEFHQELAPPGM